MRWRSLGLALGVLLGSAVPLLAQGPPEVRVVEVPGRLHPDRAEALVRSSFPGLRVIPTGHGELVLSGPPGLPAAAAALLEQLDRPARSVVVELHRRSATGFSERTVDLGVGLGGATRPSTLRRTESTSRGAGVRHLRLEEGGSGSIFLGEEVPFVASSGPFHQTVATRSAGRSMELRLLRVVPGKGARLELAGETSAFGPSTPAGPTIQREALRTSFFAPFHTPVPLGGASGQEDSRSGGTAADVQVTDGRRGPGRAGGGRTRTGTGRDLGYTVIVRPAEP